MRWSWPRPCVLYVEGDGCTLGRTLWTLEAGLDGCLHCFLLTFSSLLSYFFLDFLLTGQIICERFVGETLSEQR